MNLDELRTVQTKERQKDSLQHLRDTFYEDVADYVTDLRAERDRAAEAADDPFSDPDVSRLTDEIETAEEVVEAIYERRVGKVVKLSSFAAADMPVDEEGLTEQERDLFEDLVARIGRNKTRVLDILAGEGDAGRAASSTTDASSGTASTTDDRAARTPDRTATPEPDDGDSPARTEPAVGPGADDPTPDADRDRNQDASTKPPAPPDGPPSNAADEVLDAGDATVTEAQAADRTTVRITADVGRVLGVDDREYDLASEDVVTLPADNADALLQRDAAERLE